MRLADRFRLCYRMLVFGISTFVMWLCFELDVLLRRDRQAAIDRWVPRWAKFNLRVFGVEVIAGGKHVDQGNPYPGGDGQNDVGRIFIANHRSGMDIPVLFTVAETHVISRHDLATWPLLGRAAKRIGTLFVDRSSRKSGAKVLRDVDNALKRGEGVAMFPEGTAHEGDQVHEFKPGAFNAARRAGADVIPIGIAYGDETAYFAGQPFLRHMTRIACFPHMRVAVEVGEPLVLGDGDVVEFRELAQQRVQELVHRARTRLEI